jgi:hypothetical protein
VRITTRSLVTGVTATPAQPSLDEAQEASRVESALQASLDAHPGWRAAHRIATDDERVLLQGLVALADDGVEAPTVGDEVGDGVPLSLTWPDRKVTVMSDDLDTVTLDQLAAAGWTVLDPDVDAIRAALTH